MQVRGTARVDYRETPFNRLASTHMTPMALPTNGTEVAGALDSSRPPALQSLEAIRPLYMLPADPFAEEVLIPGFQAANMVDCMVGFFSSQVLASLAPGLATYLAGSSSRFRLIVSPLLETEDLAAIQKFPLTRSGPAKSDAKDSLDRRHDRQDRRLTFGFMAELSLVMFPPEEPATHFENLLCQEVS